jgi:hypothetical protein
MQDTWSHYYVLCAKTSTAVISFSRSLVCAYRIGIDWNFMLCTNNLSVATLQSVFLVRPLDPKRPSIKHGDRRVGFRQTKPCDSIYRKAIVKFGSMEPLPRSLLQLLKTLKHLKRHQPVSSKRPNPPVRLGDWQLFLFFVQPRRNLGLPICDVWRKHPWNRHGGIDKNPFVRPQEVSGLYQKQSSFTWHEWSNTLV